MNVFYHRAKMVIPQQDFNCGHIDGFDARGARRLDMMIVLHEFIIYHIFGCGNDRDNTLIH